MLGLSLYFSLWTRILHIFPMPPPIRSKVAETATECRSTTTIRKYTANSVIKGEELSDRTIQMIPVPDFKSFILEGTGPN